MSLPRTTIAVFALLALATASGARGEDAPPAGAADVTANTTWSGEVRLDRRVTVRQGAMLQIRPGTRIVIPWATSGVPQSAALPGIEVYGSLVAEGDAKAPIRFEPEPPPEGTKRPSRARWLGVLVHGERRDTVRFSHCLFAGAETGLQPGRSDATATDCAFLQCGVGVGVGVLWESASLVIRFVRDVAPRVARCRFGRCEVGIAVEIEGRPEISRCVFDRCRWGVANKRPGVQYPITGLGPYVDRCEFLRCTLAVQGPSRVTNSLFEGNDVVFAGSRFGEVDVTSIDRFVRASDLYWGNRALVASDIPIGDDAILADPRRRGPLPEPLSADELLGPLDAVLGLAPGSPGLARATDGGDLGAFGDAGSKRRLSTQATGGTGLVVDSWLVLGPEAPSASDAVALAAVATPRPRAAGDVEGGLEWAALGPKALSDPEAARALAASFPGARLLAATFVSETAASGASLRLAWDGTLLAWWNGTPLSLPTTPRRLRANDGTASVERKKGPNTLILLHTPRTTTGRVVAEVVDPATAAAPAGLTLSPAARPETAGARSPVASAAWSAEKGADGKPTGRGILRVSLSALVHWRDAIESRRYTLTETGGRAGDLVGAEIRYRPGEKAIVLTLPRALASGAWRLSIDGLRRPSGEAFGEPRGIASFRVP